MPWIPRWTDIAVVNHSTLIAEAIVDDIIGALGIQYRQHLGPAWGLYGHIERLGGPNTGILTSTLLGFFDDADQARALGYHDLTPSGLPLGKVFVRDCLNDGSSVAVVASHEMCEIVCDPWINAWCPDFNDRTRMWIREVCDPVENDDDAYTIDGVLMSNFVFPAYYMPDQAGPYDYRNRLPGPIPNMLPGGYLSFLQFGMIGQIYGAKRKKQSPGKVGGSGRIARIVASQNLERSTFSIP